MKRRFTRTNRTYQSTRRTFLASPDTIPTAGANDAKHFPRAEVVNIEVNHADLGHDSRRARVRRKTGNVVALAPFQVLVNCATLTGEP